MADLRFGGPWCGGILVACVAMTSGCRQSSPISGPSTERKVDEEIPARKAADASTTELEDAATAKVYAHQGSPAPAQPVPAAEIVPAPESPSDGMPPQDPRDGDRAPNPSPAATPTDEHLAEARQAPQRQARTEPSSGAIPVPEATVEACTAFNLEETRKRAQHEGACSRCPCVCMPGRGIWCSPCPGCDRRDGLPFPFVAPPKAPESFSCTVTAIVDGDTLRCRTDGVAEDVTVDLYGIDAPELDQPFGEAARRRLERLLRRGRARVVIRRRHNAKIFGEVFVGQRHVCEALLRGGLAWHDARRSNMTRWPDLQSRARSGRRGLWAKDRAVAPWEFLKAKQEGREPQAWKRPPPPTFTGDDPTVLWEGKYHGNRKTRVFHAPNCPLYNCRDCSRYFDSVQEATTAGYRRHRACFRRTRIRSKKI